MVSQDRAIYLGSKKEWSTTQSICGSLLPCSLPPSWVTVSVILLILSQLDNWEDWKSSLSGTGAQLPKNQSYLTLFPVSLAAGRNLCNLPVKGFQFQLGLSIFPLSMGQWKKRWFGMWFRTCQREIWGHVQQYSRLSHCLGQPYMHPKSNCWFQPMFLHISDPAPC